MWWYRATLQLGNGKKAVKKSQCGFFSLSVTCLLLFFSLSFIIVDIRNYMWVKFSLQFLPKEKPKPSPFHHCIIVKLCGLLFFFLSLKTKDNTKLCFIFSRIPKQEKMWSKVIDFPIGNIVL